MGVGILGFGVSLEARLRPCHVLQQLHVEKTHHPELLLGAGTLLRGGTIQRVGEVTLYPCGWRAEEEG